MSGHHKRHDRNTPPDTEHAGTQDTTGIHHRKREEHGQSIKTKFVIVGRSKRQKTKKVKKSLELIKKVVSLQKKQQNNNFMLNWYIKYSDAKKAVKVTYREYCDLYKMAEYYNSIISDYFHRHGRTLVVSFPKHFV